MAPMLTDKTMLMDVMSGLEHLSSTYTIAICSTMTANLRQDYINISNELHNQTLKVMQMANTQGYMMPQPAEPNMMQQVKTQLQAATAQ